MLCTFIFGCGRDLEPRRAPEVSAEAYRPLRLFSTRIDRAKREVEVSLLGTQRRKAVFRPGLGATLALGPLTALDAPVPSGRPAEWSRAEAPPALARVVERAFDEPDPRKGRRTRAILVARAGKLVAERYGDGTTAESPLPGWSMTKSVMGSLLGALIGRGELSLESRRLLPQWSAAGDPRADISLEDLLRMRSGLRFTEVYSDPISDVVQMLFVRPDAAGYAASLPLVEPAGRVWRYASGTSNILSLLARRALGDADYARWPRETLFGPLGMGTAVVEPDASGTFVASSFMTAAARDWARFGQLILQDGVWEGRRLLPQGWTSFCATPTPQAPEGRYGAQWWLKLNPELGGGTPAEAKIPSDAVHALGHEGQCLTVIPSRELVVLRLGLSITIDAWNHAQFLADVLDAVSTA